MYVDIPYLKGYGVIMYIHNKFDMLQKLALIEFAQAMLIAMGDTRKVVRFYPTELIIPTFQGKLMDGVLELDDGTLMNIEFQTGDLTEEFLLRCAQYAINLRVISGRHVETNIFSTGSRYKSKHSVKISENFIFKPKVFFYSEFDGLEKLINIKNKVKNNVELTNDDHYNLIFIPLMGNVDNVKVAFEVFGIVNNEKLFSKESQIKIKQCQYIVADIIADGNIKLFEEFMGLIIVSPLFSEYLENVEREIIEGIEQKARDKGYGKGLEDVARNLKDVLSDEQIAEKTGLTLEKVKQL